FLLTLARPLLHSFGILGRLAARGLVASLSRTGVAMAALTLAIAATVGIGTMIHSFRLSVSQWLTATLQADLYISLPGAHADSTHSFLDPHLLKKIAATSEVAAISTTRWVQIEDSQG